MPHITITLYPGRTPETLEKMAQALKPSMMDATGMPAGALSVSFVEKAPDEFEGFIKERLKEETLLIDSDYVKA